MVLKLLPGEQSFEHFPLPGLNGLIMPCRFTQEPGQPHLTETFANLFITRFECLFHRRTSRDKIHISNPARNLPLPELVFVNLHEPCWLWAILRDQNLEPAANRSVPD